MSSNFMAHTMDYFKTSPNDTETLETRDMQCSLLDADRWTDNIPYWSQYSLMDSAAFLKESDCRCSTYYTFPIL